METITTEQLRNELHNGGMIDRAEGQFNARLLTSGASCRYYQVTNAQLCELHSELTVTRRGNFIEYQIVKVSPVEAPTSADTKVSCEGFTAMKCDDDPRWMCVDTRVSAKGPYSAGGFSGVELFEIREITDPYGKQVLFPVPRMFWKRKRDVLEAIQRISKAIAA